MKGTGVRSKRQVHTKSKSDKDKADKPEKPGFKGWGPLMKKFSEDNKVVCQKSLIELTYSLHCPSMMHMFRPVVVDRSAQTIEKQFSTCSKYEGTADVLGFAGYGTYTFPSGVIYEGDFEDGMFQGDGMLTYPSGIILRGTWNKGSMIERTLYFADGLRYSEDAWDYCKMPDRRFSIEYDLGLQAATHSLLTADQPTRDIPPGHYDTLDGFFEVENRAIYKVDDSTALIRCPKGKELDWIIDNCRVDAEVPLGPRGDLYEDWPEPQLNFGEMQLNDANVASSTSKTWGFEGEKEDDGWRLKFSQSKARLSIVATRSVAEFGARQQKTRFKWGNFNDD